MGACLSGYVIEGKVHSNDLVTLTLLARLSPGRTGNTLEMVPTVEAVLINVTLLLAETAPTTSKNRVVERWAMPTWCHMFNSTLIGTVRIWLDELPPESIDGYKDLKAAFLAYFMQQKKYIKDPVEIHNIKQRDGETIEDFMKRFKVEIGRMKGAPECMRISRFMNGVNNPEFTNDSMSTVTRHNVTQSFTHIKEITFPPLAANKGTGGPLVIEAEISGHAVHRIYVDGGSSMEVLYEHCFNRLWPEFKSQMVSTTMSLTGFSGETIWPLGQLRLLVTIGDAEHYTRAWMNFMIVRSPSPYNGIIGRPRIREIQAIPSTAHEMIKFPVNGGIVTIRSTILTPTECTTIAATPKDQEKRLKHEYHNRLSSTDSISEKDTPLSDRKTRAGPEARQGNPSGGTKTGGGRNSMRSILPRLVIQPDHGEEGRRLNSSVATILSVSWTPTKAIIKYKWPNKMRKRQLSTPVTGAIVKMERHARGAQYHIPTADICERPDPRRLPRAGMLLTSPEGTKFTYALRFQFTASNNEEEYEALIAGLRISAQMGVRNVHVSIDSKLVANQVLGTYVAKKENMVKYLKKAKRLISGFANFSITQVPRIEEEGPTWMTPIMEYLKDGTLPGDRKEARKLRIKARQYELLEEVLYMWSFLEPWLRCAGPLQADYVIWEIYKGSCSMHAGPWSVVAKATRLGYYWPTVHRDAQDMIHTCNVFQGIDIVGPFSKGPGKVKFFIVAMDYFTKWIEVKAMETITDSQFSDNPFKDWCEKLNITQCFASVKHPQSNGLIERANQSLGEGIKAHLGEGNKNWIEELPQILWAYRTMIKSSHGDTLFSLTYGTKAIIPAEIGMPMYRTAIVDAVHNNEELRLNLDLLEERCECAAIREAKAKLKMTKYYNTRVRGVIFRPGDFVYRSNEVSHAMDGGKLGPKWEGPYEVTEALGDGAYRLRSIDDIFLPRTWNVANLKKCYL
nr:reverse transcriptase domain-containing protein [Tanacetum cinerariifolium]